MATSAPSFDDVFTIDSPCGRRNFVALTLHVGRLGTSSDFSIRRGAVTPSASSRNAGTGSCVRPRDDEHGAVLLARERVDEQLQADRERERLVRALAAERHEVRSSARPASTSPYVTFPIETSATIGLAVAARDRDRERVRPGQLRAAVGMPEPRAATSR